jgi:hypothetical protein
MDCFAMGNPPTSYRKKKRYQSNNLFSMQVNNHHMIKVNKTNLSYIANRKIKNQAQQIMTEIYIKTHHSTLDLNYRT